MILKIATKLLRKVVGKKAASVGAVVLDGVVETAANELTGGIASKVEDEIKDRKARRK